MKPFDIINNKEYYIPNGRNNVIVRNRDKDCVIAYKSFSDLYHFILIKVNVARAYRLAYIDINWSENKRYS